MWKKIYELLEQLVTLAQRVSRHDKQIDELRQEVRELAGMIHRLAIEANRLADRQTSDREKVELWVENQMLRFERRLPPARSDAEEPSKDGVPSLSQAHNCGILGY